MRSFLRTQIWPAVAVLLALTIVTGFIYPAVVTAVAQVAFPSQANGSQIVANGKTVGSALIGQTFDDPKYLWGRPSAAGAGYDPTLSGGSNLGPTSQALIDQISKRVDALRAANGSAPIPIDLVTASASGLDPDISPAAAEYQIPRVARARGISEDAVRAVVARHTSQPLLWFLGEPTVNVLAVNLDLDGLLR
ncbi:MAG: potassium-transporting ATPase subunit KdpC [Candidatus Limnocylindrales bacterium]